MIIINNDNDYINLDIQRYLNFSNCPRKTIVDRHSGSMVRELIPITVIHYVE